MIGKSRQPSLLFYLIYCGVTFLSAITLLPSLFWFQEVSSNFGALYLILHLSFVLVILARRKQVALLSSLLTLLISGYFISHYFRLIWPAFQSSLTTRAGPSIVTGYQELDNQSEHIVPPQANPPDILGLFWSGDPSQALMNAYPYSLSKVSPPYGTLTLLSKYPLNQKDGVGDETNLPPYIWAEVQLSQEKTADVVLVRMFPLFESTRFYDNGLLTRRLSTKIRHSDAPVVVFGDFSGSIFSSTYRRFSKGAGLKNEWGYCSVKCILGLGTVHRFFKGDTHPLVVD